MTILQKSAGSAEELGSLKKKKYLALDFTEALESLLQSGLSVKDGLEMLGASCMNNSISSLCAHILSHINRGLSIADAITSMERIFPPLYRGMIRFGEMIGSTDKIFSRLGVYLREQKKIREKIFSAMLYPAMALTLAVVGSASLIVFILPKLETILAGFAVNGEGGAEVSLENNIFLLKVSLAIFLSIISIIPLSFPVLKYLRLKKSALAFWVDRGLLKTPFLGNYILTREVLNFSFAMEILTSGGIPIGTALYESANLLGNSALRRNAFAICEEVTNGGQMAKIFARDDLFPEYFSRWIAIGEQARDIESVFSQTRLYYQEELDRIGGRLIILIEPCMITLTGFIILGITIGLILPIFSLFGSLQF